MQKWGFFMIDTHCHVYGSEMENAENIIMKAKQMGIELILNGTDPSSNREVLELAERHDNIHAALGYFYTLADTVGEEDIALLDRQLENDNVIAVGEIGLDYYHGKDDRESQIRLFERMLELAESHGLPVIVHSRNASQDTYDILKRHGVEGSLHCYQGSPEMAREFVKLGFYIGIGGTITYAGSKKIKRTAREADISRLLVETDSPYLSPEKKRGEINTPFNLRCITGKLAEELEMKEEDIIRITDENAKRLFGI